MSRSISIDLESFEIAGGFTISRGSRTHANVLVTSVTEGSVSGRGECVPYARYGETMESVQALIQEITPALKAGMSRHELQTAMPAGAARNAVDCALWDLEAKLSSKSAQEIAGLASLAPVTTAYTISVGTPEVMAEKTAKAAHRPLLKVKLAGPGDDARIEAVRRAAPDSTLIVDANEAWDETCFGRNMDACERAGVALIEQPLPAGKDAVLSGLDRKILICADESLHTRAGLEDLRSRYDAINIKLDKAGGLTEALALLKHARDLEFKIMIGCMLGTSLAMAPAVLLAQGADYVDLDGPLLLTQDRVPGLVFDGSTLYPPEADLWG